MAFIIDTSLDALVRYDTPINIYDDATIGDRPYKNTRLRTRNATSEIFHSEFDHYFTNNHHIEMVTAQGVKKFMMAARSNAGRAMRDYFMCIEEEYYKLVEHRPIRELKQAEFDECFNM